MSVPGLRIAAALPVVLFAVLSAGCFGHFHARIPADLLTDGWSKTDSGGGEKWKGLGASWSFATYEVDPEPDGPLDDGPYAASLTIFSIDTASPLSRDDAIEQLERQVRDNAGDQGIALDDASRAAGERTLASGVRTTWFTYHAEVGAGSSLFEPGRDARVVGEAWYDEPEGITVVAVGLAQVQGGGATGRYFVNPTNWERIVEDPSGSIEGITGQAGLLYNTRSH